MADVVLVNILAKEMRVLYCGRRIERHTERSNAARLESHNLWQRRRDEYFI